MAVYENGKALPGTVRKPRSKAAVTRLRKARAAWKAVAATRIKLGKRIAL